MGWIRHGERGGHEMLAVTERSSAPETAIRISAIVTTENKAPRMTRTRLYLFATLCLAAVATGCTHEQLRKDSVNEAATVGDLQTQQVLDNLAMFVYNYNSMPYFAFPNQGAAIVTDQVNGSGTAAWGRPITTGATAPFSPRHFGDFLLTSLGLSAGAQRSQQESFVMTPINDPRKLELMRCAYQLAVSNCGYGPPIPKSCPDCNARFNTFYTGTPDPSPNSGAVPISQMRGGTITSECLRGPCWFHVGCEKEVPKCPCLLVGCYCGVYVWVGPEGRDGLSKLTMAILDYATHEQPQKLTKDVTFYVDALGLPTGQRQGVAQIRATIGIDDDPTGILKLSDQQEVHLEQELQDRVRRLSAMLEKTTDPAQRKSINDDIEDAKQKLYFIDHQLSSPGLKNYFMTPGAAPVAPYSIIPGLQQEQNALSAPAD